MIKVCLKCGESFETSPRINAKFCSRACYDEYRKTHKNTHVGVCFYCHKRYDALRKTQKYCSWECYVAHKRRNKPKKPQEKILKRCLWCNKPFEPRPNRKFCCSEHANLYRQIEKRLFALYPFEGLEEQLARLRELGHDFRFSDETLNKFYELGD